MAYSNLVAINNQTIYMYILRLYMTGIFDELLNDMLS